MTGGEANPRFVVTSLERSEAGVRHLYETVYCARGDREDHIKERHLDRFADRTSTATMQANRCRLWFPCMVRYRCPACAASAWRVRISLRLPAAPSG